MTEPVTKQEYDAKYVANSEMGGLGEETFMVFPCPACAEPGWKTQKLVDSKVEMQKESVCNSCGRGFRAILNVDTEDEVQFQIVQTAGPDITAPWLAAIKRI